MAVGDRGHGRRGRRRGVGGVQHRPGDAVIVAALVMTAWMLVGLAAAGAVALAVDVVADRRRAKYSARRRGSGGSAEGPDVAWGHVLGQASGGSPAVRGRPSHLAPIRA
jgi:hypothetical protein